MSHPFSNGLSAPSDVSTLITRLSGICNELAERTGLFKQRYSRCSHPAGCARVRRKYDFIKASQGIYAAPRVFLDLREAGESCSKHRIAWFMRENGIRAQAGYRTRRHIAGTMPLQNPFSAALRRTASKRKYTRTASSQPKTYQTTSTCFTMRLVDISIWVASFYGEPSV